MSSMFQACSSDSNEVYYEEASGEIYDGAHLWDNLRYADIEGSRYTTDADNNIVEMVPSDEYVPERDLPIEELDLSDEEREYLLKARGEYEGDDEVDEDEEYDFAAEFGEDRLAELEEEAGLWDDENLFDANIVVQYLGTVYEYVLNRAKEDFTEDDYLTEDDLRDFGNENLEIDLTDEELDEIAVAATGHHLNEEEPEE